MILVGVQNDTHVLASIGHYDCRSFGKDDQYIMCDGGQIGTCQYAGYTRKSGKHCMFEVEEQYTDLYYDYNYNTPRKFGIWKKEDVRILTDEEATQFLLKANTQQYLYENVIWGTRGKSGEEPLQYKFLKDLSKDHLVAIKETQHISNQTKEAIDYWLNESNLENS